MTVAEGRTAATAREEAHLLAYAVEELLEMWEGEPLSGGGAVGGGIVGRLSVLEMNERLWEYALTVSEYLFDGISSPRNGIGKGL